MRAIAIILACALMSACASATYDVKPRHCQNTWCLVLVQRS